MTTERRALIVGIDGFCGSYLAEWLLKQHNQVSGTVKNKADRIRYSSLRRDLNVGVCDVCDAASVRACVAETKPDVIYHMAALLRDDSADRAGADCFEVNVQGTIHLLEAVRAANPEIKILLPGSAAEYGLVAADAHPITEQTPFHPIGIYGVSKLAQEMVGQMYFLRHGLRVVRTRAFNITGPRENSDLVCSNFAKQIAAIERGLREPSIRVGNLTPKRDFTDVRDIVKGYFLAADKGVVGQVYNLCSGRAHSVQAILDTLLSFTSFAIRIESEPARIRPTDIPIQVGDYSAFNRLTGWRPEIALADSLRDLLEYWRERTRHQSNGLTRG